MESGSITRFQGAPAPVHIRPASEADHAAIERLAERATQDLLRPFLTADQMAEVAVFTPLDPWLLKDNTYYVIECSGKIIASGGWSRHEPMIHDPAAGSDRPTDLREGTARIRAMYTDPNFARMGFGRTILSVAESAARMAGIHLLELIATPVGEHLYLACGYDRMETIRLKTPNGVFIDVARMQKLFAPSGARQNESMPCHA